MKQLRRLVCATGLVAILVGSDSGIGEEERGKPKEAENPYLSIPLNDIGNCYVIWFSSGQGFTPKTPAELLDKLNSFLTRKVSMDQVMVHQGRKMSASILVTDVLQKNEIKEVLKKQPELSVPHIERLDSNVYEVFKKEKQANKRIVHDP